MRSSMMLSLLAALAAALMLLACAQPSAPPPPTAAPSAPTKAAAPAPTKAPEPAPTKAAAAAPTQAPTAAPAKKVDFPEKGKAITIVAGFTPGSAVDIGARLLAIGLEKELGTSVQVVNKTGAGSQVAWTDVSQARPDGYTVSLMSFLTFFTTYLDPSRKAVYDSKSFQPVAAFASIDNVLFTKPDSSYKSLKDLVDAAKASPEKVKFGTNGALANPHLVGIMLEEAAGVKFAYVHFGGGSETVTRVLDGSVDVGCGTPVETMGHYKGGTLRFLATAGDKQSTVMPDVKTAEAQGYKVFNTVTFGLAVPARTPMEVVDVLSNGVKAAMGMADIKDKLIAGGMAPDFMDRARYEAYWSETEKAARPVLEKALAQQR